MTTQKVNKENVQQLFDKAIGRIEREIGVAIACYRWAQANDYNPDWTAEAGRRLTRVLGVKVEDFQATAYTCGDGDLDRGCELIERFGAGRLDDARKSLSKRDLTKLLETTKDAKQTPEAFDRVCAQITADAQRKASEAGRRLRDRRRGIDAGEGKIAGQIVDYRQAYETTKELLEQEKQRRLAAEVRADDLQRKVEELTNRLLATA